MSEQAPTLAEPAVPSTAAPGRVGGLLALMTATMGFSWGFIIAKAIGLPAPVIGFWRLVIGVAALGLAWILTRSPGPVRWVPVIGAGIFFGLHQLLFIAATQQTSVAIVTLFAAMQPLLVALVSQRLVGERPSPWLKWCGVLAFVGIGVVVHANFNDPSRTPLGDALAGANLLTFTAYFLFAKRSRTEGTSTLALTTSMMVVALVVVALAMPFVEPRVPEMSWQWGLIALMALGPGNGHLLINWAHRHVSAALASLFLATIPILSGIWAHLVFDEPYGIEHVLGMILVVAAVELGRRADKAAQALPNR